jgi:TonB family protein
MRCPWFALLLVACGSSGASIPSATPQPPPAPARSTEPEQAARVEPPQAPAGPLDGGLGEGVVGAQLVKIVPPAYTREAAEKRVQGTILLKCTITVEGTVTNCRVLKGLPYGMTELVVAAVQQSKYTPALFQGKPIAVDLTIPIRIVAPAPQGDSTR